MRLAIALACAVSFSACADGLRTTDDSFAEPDLAGSLRIPLTAEDAAGTVYRLRDVHIEISGSALLSVSDADGLRARESLLTALPPGEYTVYLRPGWRLMARSPEGVEAPASADLLSKNPLTLRVGELGDETLKLVFKRGDEELRLGATAGVRVTRVEQPSVAPSTL
jgi:hypothetical protein